MKFVIDKRSASSQTSTRKNLNKSVIASSYCINHGRTSLENPQYYLNRDTSGSHLTASARRAADESIPVERLKFLSISASNLDEFFEIRVAAMVQQIEDGYNDAGQTARRSWRNATCWRR